MLSGRGTRKSRSASDGGPSPEWQSRPAFGASRSGGSLAMGMMGDLMKVVDAFRSGEESL